MILNIFLSLLIIFICAILFGISYTWLAQGLRRQSENNINLEESKELFLGSKDLKQKVEYKAYIDYEQIPKISEKNFEYKSIKSCKIFKQIYQSQTRNLNDCLGFGDCITTCEQNAIIIEDGRAHVTSVCNGCGKCIKTCPNSLINMITFQDYATKKDQIRKKYFKFWQVCFNIFNKE